MPRLRQSALKQDLLLRGVWEGLGTPECLVTGGYVRDRLLGRSTVDLDLVLPGDLEAARGPARRLAARLDGSAHVLGRDEKRVWRIETSELKVELWPLGALDLEADVRRRDFTCNALMWRLPEGPLIDLVGGTDDLKARVVRAVRKKNLQDDPVRLVRAARFLAQYAEFELDDQTATWIRTLAPRVRRSPPERLGQELLRLATAPGAERGLRFLLEFGLVCPAAPGKATCTDDWLAGNLGAASRMRASTHPMRSALAAAGEAAPLALLLRAWGAPSQDDLAPYAWPRPLRLHAAHAAKMLDDALAASAGPAADRRALIHRAGAAFPTLMALAAAVAPGRNWKRWWRQWRNHGAELVDPVPCLTGEEIARLLGVEPGPALGRSVEALVNAQVRGEVRARGGAERWLRRWFEAQSPRLWQEN